jgi:hypothetical protein
MTAEDRFRDYIAAFNAGEWDRLVEFYAPDVRLVIGSGRALVGRQAIVDFYSEVKAQARRTIEVLACLSEGNVLAAELESEFLALRDIPDFAVRPMNEGDRYYINSLAFYDFAGDQFTRIRAATMVREYRPRPE